MTYGYREYLRKGRVRQKAATQVHKSSSLLNLRRAYDITPPPAFYAALSPELAFRTFTTITWCVHATIYRESFVRAIGHF